MPDLLVARNQGASSAVWDDVPRPRPMFGGEIAIDSLAGRAAALRARTYILSVGDAQPWMESAIKSLQQLFALPQNWDSYGARPLDPRAFKAAIEAINELVGGKVPLPAIVPTSSGWIQLEWHRPGVDLEIELFSPSSARLYYVDERTGAEREEVLHGQWDAAATLLSGMFST